MRKIFAAFLVFMLVLATGCGGDKKVSNDNKQIKLGTITHLNVTETLLDNYFEKATSRMSQTSTLYAPKHIFFDNMTSMLVALESGQIDALSTYQSVAKYLVAKNTDLEIMNNIPKAADSFCCAMRQDDTELKKEFDAALLKLTADGTLAKLVKTYITDADYNATPTAVDMPKFDGAKTVKIGVTGDLPPLDLITADDKPTGFNTAVLAAISQLIGKNFELVKIDGGARAIALTSGEIDVIFWVAVPRDDTLVPPNCDTPEGVILTEPYFTDEIAHVKVKK